MELKESFDLHVSCEELAMIEEALLVVIESTAYHELEKEEICRLLKRISVLFGDEESE